MAAELVNDDLGIAVEQNGWPHVGPRAGLIEMEIDLDDLTYSETGDWINVFTFDAFTVVLAAGIEVVTASTGACNVTLGTGGDNSVLTATSIATTGLKATTIAAPVSFAAAADLTLAVSADPAGATVRVWAYILDPRSLVTG